MNDPRTCVYGHARKFGACGERGTCTRPRGLACLCGLVKARVPEPGPDKLTRPRNVYTSRRLSGWTHKMIHTCVGCGEDFDTEHRAAFHVCPGPKFASGGVLPGFNCAGTVTGRLPAPREPWPFPGPATALQGAAQRSLGLEDIDLSKVEERALAMCTCEEAAEIKQAAWDALGRCPWDDWKPGRDVV